MRLSRIHAIAAALCLCVALPARAQIGPDVIVGSLHNIGNYNAVGGIDAISVGTTSCNVGDELLLWQAGNNLHPVIGQHLYRYHEGRFEMIGQSWLKHGFTTINSGICGTCDGNLGSVLGLNCSDPYSAGLNGSQSGLGPKFQVNAYDGVFSYPFFGAGMQGDSVYKRLQVSTSDLDPANYPGARYFVEGHYVTQDDAQAGNGLNNASYREVVFTGGPADYSVAFAAGSTTVQTLPAIFAYADVDPDAVVETVDVPGEGRFHVAYKAEPGAGGLIHYEFAVHNLNSHRSARSVSVDVGAGATVQNIGFHDINYHSGEMQSGADWSSSYSGGEVTWSTSTHTAGNDLTANALRWGTTYTFRFDSDAIPSTLTLGLFRPGSPTDLTVNLNFGLAPFGYSFPSGVPTSIVPDQTNDVDFEVVPLVGGVDSNSGRLFASVNGGPYVQSAVAHLGGTSYRAILPAADCNGIVTWYLEFDTPGGATTIASPENAPTEVYQSVADQVLLIEIFADTMEDNTAMWTTQNIGLGDGQWDRGVPVGGGDRGDPAVDSNDVGSACWLTDNVDGNSDVDNGTTILISPSFDLRTYLNPAFTFQFWYDNNDNSAVDDVFEIEISGDGGANWVNVETYGDSNNQWNFRRVVVLEHLPALTSQVRMRFLASDLGAGSIVEAGLDDFRLEVCPLIDPVLAAGNVGATAGGPYDVLRVNGTAGGPTRHVVLGWNQPLTFDIDTPPTATAGRAYAIFGRFNTPMPNEVFDVGFGIGSFLFWPCPANPFDPNLYELFNNLGPGCVPLLPAGLTPYTFVYPPGIPFDSMSTLQGIIEDPSGGLGLSITNAVVVQTRSDF